MIAPATAIQSGELGTLLRGEAEQIAAWTERLESRRLAFHLGVIISGAGLYGAAMGWWRAPQQALFVAIKFPLIILFVTIGNALLNAMLAPLLGLNLSFRQSFLAVLMSFTLVSAILGAFSPLLVFLVWSVPPMPPEVKVTATYALIKMTHVVVIAFAGIAGNVRLFQLLTRLGGGKTIARRVLFAWLTVNLFLGSQLTWIARPFIGTPQLPVQFLRATAFQSNFFEDVFRTAQHVLQAD